MKIRSLIIVIFLCFLVSGCDSNDNTNSSVIESIDTSEVKEIIDNKDEDYILIDVREESEYSEGHIFNSVNVPLGDISTINYSKDKTIIVYCRSGARSHEAAVKLKDMGYKVKDMGGIVNWKYDLE